MPFVTQPHTIYHRRRLNQNVKCTNKQSRVDWGKCTDKKEREIVIRETFHIARESATEENVEEILNSLGVGHVREYLGILMGIEYPLDRPYHYHQRYLRQFRNVKKRNLRKDEKYYIKLKFNKLTFEKTLYYLKRFLDDWLGFFYLLKKWRIQNDHFFERALVNVAVTFQKESKKSRVKKKGRRPNFVELCMPYTKCDFPDAPEPPPAMTPLQLFRLMLTGEGEPRDEKVVENAFEKLPLVVRNGIEERVVDYREEFRMKLLNYVRTMTMEKRKLFLGIKREYYFKLFLDDVFEEKYPNEKYPVYKRNSDDFLKKSLLKEEEKSVMETSSSSDDSSDSDHFDVFELVDDSLLRLKNYGFQIEESSDSDT